MEYRLENLNPLEFAGEPPRKHPGAWGRARSLAHNLAYGAAIALIGRWEWSDGSDPVVVIIAQTLSAAALFALLYFSARIAASRLQDIPLSSWGRSRREERRGMAWWLAILRIFFMLPIAAVYVGYLAWTAFSRQTIGESWLRTETLFVISGVIIVAGIFFANDWAVASSGGKAIRTENLRRRVFILLVAGPLACSLTALACLCFALLASKSVQPWLVRQLVMNAFVLVMLVIEDSGGNSGERNDWKVLKGLWHSGPAADRVAAQYVLRYSAPSQCVPQDEDMIRLAVGEDDGSREHFDGKGMRYAWLIDRNETDEAENTLAWLLLHSEPGRTRSLFCLEAAFFWAWYRRDGTSAEEWLAAAGQLPARDRCTELTAKAAAALAESNRAECRSMANAALDAAAKFPFTNAARSARDRARILLSEAS